MWNVKALSKFVVSQIELSQVEWGVSDERNIMMMMSDCSDCTVVEPFDFKSTSQIPEW